MRAIKANQTTELWAIKANQTIEMWAIKANQRIELWVIKANHRIKMWAIKENQWIKPCGPQRPIRRSNHVGRKGQSDDRTMWAVKANQTTEL